MDLNKCRTCYTNLESNDLYLKLNIINKNSTLSLADKLRKLVPVMDLKEVDKLLICMQCSIHLETAYTFYTTCLETEEKFQKCNIIKSQSRRSCTSDEKKEEMVCKICNLHFSSKNIFDLHMKLMHLKKEPMYEEVVNDINIRVAKNNKPLLEMVFLQTDLKKRRKDSVEESSQEPENKRRRLVLQKHKKSNKDKQKKLETSKTNRKKRIDKYIELPRNKNGKFKKSGKIHKSQEIVETAEIKSRETKVMLPDRSCKHLTRNKITTTAAVTEEDVNVTETKIENPNKTTRCKFCAKTFTSNEKMIRHVKLSHPGKCQTCALCNRFYLNMKHHKKQYGCDLFNFRKQNLTISDILSEKTKDTGQIIYYMRSEKNLPICLICRRICLSVKCLETHLTTMHTTSIRCLVCRKKFPAIPYCSHMGRGCSKLISAQSFNYTSDGECICPICNQVFKDETILKSHLVHHLYQNLQCEQCNETFVQIVSYCQHVVKGCQKNKSPTKKDSTLNNSMFVKCDTESSVENTVLPQEDPLKEDEPLQLQEHLPLNLGEKSPPPIIELQCKNVKVEPTALLDQSGFVMGDDSLSNDNDDNLPTKFMNITNVNAETSPEFIYVVQNIDNQPSE